MPGPEPSLQQPAMPEAALVNRAIRVIYGQVMLNAVFVASTGGMFLVGFAIDLGADNVLLGAMSAVPQVFVVFQFLSAWWVQRGASRKKLSLTFALITPLCWSCIAAMPFFAPVMGVTARMTVLIGVIALVTLSAQLAMNARASWLGELIPEARRGRFFGYCSLFGGIIAAGFAIVEGGFLDFIRSKGLFAFTALFFFGAIFGLISAALLLPQPDCPLPGGHRKVAFRSHLRAAIRNRPFVLLAVTSAVISMNNIAGPFYNAYCLRDVGLSFLGLGLLNSVATAAALLSAPFWGKLADRFGCRPVLVVGLLAISPLSAIWLFVPPGAPHRAYLLLPWTHFLAGLCSAAITVSLASLIYRLSNPEGRAVQLAGHSAFVALSTAPMPLLGGWAVSRLEAAGWHVDLRLTFYAGSTFFLIAALIARKLREPAAIRARTLVFAYFPSRLARLGGMPATWAASFASLVRLQRAPRAADEPPEQPDAP